MLDNKIYLISKKRLLELLAAEAELAALTVGGVDNWEWYDDSCTDFLNNLSDEYLKPIDDFEQVAEEDIKEFVELEAFVK